jgi:hypothetical protein
MVETKMRVPFVPGNLLWKADFTERTLAHFQ